MMSSQSDTPTVVEQIPHFPPNDEIELVPQNVNQEASYMNEIEQASLPPTDGGRAAYIYLFTCFIGEAMVWALPFSYGVFQDYYSKTALFSSQQSSIAIVGTCATGILYLGGALVYAAIYRFPAFQKFSPLIGMIVMSFALVVASFATSVWHLILTQGILFGAGGCLLLYTQVYMLDGWFVRRRGLAFGILCTGNGVAGAIVPFILNWCLSKYGFRTTLRSWAILNILLVLPLIPFIKPRIPLSVNAQPRYTSYRFIISRTFWLYQIANILQALGYFIPTIYLSTYAQDLGLTKATGSLLIALVNVAAVFSQLCIGYLVDRSSVSTVMLISAIGSSLVSFVFWGTATSLPLLIIFAIGYGLFAGGFTSTFIGMTKETLLQTTGADSGMVFGLFCVGRGVGAVTSGPLSEALLSLNARSRFGNGGFSPGSLGYGKGYGSLIVFTGVTALCGGLSFVGLKANILKLSRS